ncbi:Geraniol 8-hydroxylase-like protein [Drosera capensis]
MHCIPSKHRGSGHQSSAGQQDLESESYFQTQNMYLREVTSGEYNPHPSYKLVPFSTSRMNHWNSVLHILMAWFCTHLLVSLLKRSKLCPRRLPPGPLPLPILGNMVQLGRKPHKSFAKLARVYGPIMTIELGNLTTVVITSAPLAKQVLKKNDVAFSNRTPWDAVSIFNHHEASVAFLPSNPRWRSLRKVCNSYIFVNSKIELSRQLRKNNVEKLVNFVHECRAACVPVDIGRAVFTTSLNLLSNIFFSKDLGLYCYGVGDPDEFKELVWAMAIEAGTPNIVDFFPMLKMFDPQGIRCRSEILVKKIFAALDSIIHERVSSRKPSDCYAKNDVLDALLELAQGERSENNISDVAHLFLDLFTAGTDTTSTSIEWAMTELIHSPETLKKAQSELERVTGKGNPCQEDDIIRLPYLQAIIKETFRLHPPVPFLIPRKVLEDIELSGYTVPKNAQVLVNIWGMGRDDSVWTDAESFKPERFLGSKMDFKGGDFELIPFGAGRRICPGMSLACRMVPYLLGSLIHSFSWKLEGGIASENVSLDDKFGFTVTKAQPLRVIPFRS